MNLHRLLQPLVLIIALACAGTAIAQTVIYKVRYADGRIGFTDSPPRDATILERRDMGRPVNVVPAPPSRPSPSERTNAPSAAPATASGAAASDLGAAWQEVNDAQRALDEARRALATGLEPLPGERLGLAGGGSRLSPEYEARVRALQEAVSSAETRLQDAQAARNARR